MLHLLLKGKQMAGITDIKTLLSTMEPELDTAEYVFCCIDINQHENYLTLKPIATFVEQEGLTLVLNKDIAVQAGLAFDGVFKRITLTVHSSLSAVGLTAAVASALAQNDISANVIAAFYHDHVFVPAEKATLAISTLIALSATQAHD